MQAIVTKYLCPTNVRGSRYKATCQAGSITVSADAGLSLDDNHAAACAALCKKLDDANEAKYGPESRRIWSMPKAVGQLPDGAWVHVFIDQSEAHATTWSILPHSAREMVARHALAEFPDMARGNENWGCGRISITPWNLLTDAIRSAITAQLG